VLRASGTNVARSLCGNFAREAELDGRWGATDLGEHHLEQVMLNLQIVLNDVVTGRDGVVEHQVVAENSCHHRVEPDGDWRGNG
jgi:hypothetical protein